MSPGAIPYILVVPVAQLAHYASTYVRNVPYCVKPLDKLLRQYFHVAQCTKNKRMVGCAGGLCTHELIPDASLCCSSFSW